MGLTLSTAVKLLREIVGGPGGFRQSNITPYLALSSTEPTPEPVGGSYNVTEPSAASYSRKSLGYEYFRNDPTTGEIVEGKYTVSIKNSNEIHFNEALQDWGTVTHFAIFPDISSTIPIYVGELESYTDVTSEVNAENFESKKSNLYIITGGSGTAEDPYIYEKLSIEAQYDASIKYFEKKLVIKEGTVPLIRKDYLKISVQ